METGWGTRPWESNVSIQVGTEMLHAILAVPPGAEGIVLFAHGSGSGRLSPRNNFVARVLQDGGLATVLLDLLAEDEAKNQSLVFDIDFLATRLLGATKWVQQEDQTRLLRVGYFGASTGAAAALEAASKEQGTVKAVVSRGGRPDLAAPFLSHVEAPTLLIVGGDDRPVIAMNQEAYAELHGEKELVIVPGATHLFEEPGTLEQVASLARQWFQRHLLQRRTSTRLQ